MIEAEQFAFDFEAAERERPITEHFERLARLNRESGEWSEENLCLAWVVSPASSSAWRDWWQQLPSYTREAMLREYRAEQAFAEACGKNRIRPFSQVWREPGADELAREREIIETMKAEIKEAALAGRGMPRRECEEMSWLDKMTFRHRMQMAMLELGVVIVNVAEPVPEKPKRRRKP